MAGFEQNQQDQLNMNNGIDQVKQFQANLDKANASIGAAELAAEEEQLGVKLKNLSKLQQTKLTQLGQLLELEERGIQELAKLKLSLSNRQFEIRKKEIQKEFQLYKAATEELFKAESKHRSSKPTTAPKKTSSAADDLKTSTKKNQADTAIQKADKKVQSATYGVDKTRQEITDAISSLRYTIDEVASTAQEGTRHSAAQQPAEVKATGPSTPDSRQFTNDGLDYKDRVGLGEYSFESVLKEFGALRKQLTGKQNSSTLEALNTVTKDKGATSQTSLDIAGALLKNIESAAKAEEELQEFKKDLELNSILSTNAERQRLEGEHAKAEKTELEKRSKAEAKALDLQNNEPAYYQEAFMAQLQAYADEQNNLEQKRINNAATLDYLAYERKNLIAQEEFKLARAHEDAAIKAQQANITAEAKAEDLLNNKKLYLAEAHDKLTTGHAEKQNQLKLSAIDAEGKANDLINNKNLYASEIRLAKENAFADERNRLTEGLITAEENLKYDNAHKQELLDQEAFKLQVGHAETLHKANLDLLAARAKAEDLEANIAKYQAEAKAALELAHIQERNKLTDDIIKAEEKRNDLLHNKKLYKQEEEAALNKALIDEQNKLTEDLYKTETSIAYTKAHKQELLDVESQKLRNEQAAAYDKYQKDMLAEESKANDLEQNKRKYYNKELHDLELGYAKEQNRLTEDEYKHRAQLDYIEANEKKLTEQNIAALRSEHAAEEIQRRKDHINALARSTMLEEDRQTLLEDAKKKLADEHTNKQNDLKQGAIDNETKAYDLRENREAYIFEARMAHENAFYARKNELEEESIQIAESIAWDKAHIEEVMAQGVAETQNRHAKEYGEYLKKAGKYAVSQKEFEKDKARKDNKAAKKEAVGGIVDGLKKFGTGEFSMTDIKKSYGEFMGQRTAELNTFNRDEYVQKLQAENPGLSEEEINKRADAAEAEAAASAKLTAQFELLAEAAGGLQAVLDANVRKIADVQGFVDTRLQGSQANEQKGLSYWKQLLKDAKSIAGASPFIKQEKLVENIKALVDKGISFDIKQRAFLMTVQEKIANTFNAADGTLLRLIRIQQQDTTAGRLGMESALNSFLNSMYETSEYLSDVAANVRSSLEEMQALMEGAAGTELEFQVQKWMGSLYSVGMSQNAVQQIAQTFGQIASGDISGLTGSGTGNLLIMAANEAGMSIADILQDGLNADDTNKLMQAMVNYLAEIAETSSDSKVVQQQLANVYGIKASDLRAATNLASSVKDVSKQNVAYSGMLGQLEKMMNTIRFRTSISEGMTNMWDNVMYSMASTQASNPILYALPKMANLLRDVTGGSGIDLPFINVMGFGVDLNTSVADLMSIASLAGTALGALGPLFTGIVDLVNPLVGSSMLKRAGIKTSGKVPVLARGSASPLQNIAGASLSESGLVGNSSGEDVKNATLQDAEDDKKKQMVEAKDEESADDVVIKSQQAIIDIYNLLEEVAHGSQSLRVRLVNGNGAGGAGAISCNCNHTDPLTGEPSTSVTTPGQGSDGTDNGNWVLTF